MVAERMKISPYMAWWIVHPIQFGMAELWFSRALMKYAGYDGWMGVVIAGIAVHFLLWLIYGILNKGQGSVIAIHRQVFGKWLGGGFSIILILLLLMEGVDMLRSYAEIVQVWLFPDMKTWVIGVMFLFLSYYAVTGGFRVVVGVCFFGFLLPFFVLTPVLIAPLHYSHFLNFFPVFQHSVPDLLRSAKSMTLSFIGFEGLLIAYPFIKNAPASQKWAHFGNLFTTLFYLMITFITFSFFNQKLMERLIWPKLNLVQLTELPFLGGFQYIFISLWMLVVMPNVVYAAWTSSRAAKELFAVKQRKTLIVVLVILLGALPFFDDHADILKLNQVMADFGFYFLVIYIPFLWVAQRIRGRWMKREGEPKMHQL